MIVFQTNTEIHIVYVICTFNRFEPNVWKQTLKSAVLVARALSWNPLPKQSFALNCGYKMLASMFKNACAAFPARWFTDLALCSTITTSPTKTNHRKVEIEPIKKTHTSLTTCPSTPRCFKRQSFPAQTTSAEQAGKCRTEGWSTVG